MFSDYSYEIVFKQRLMRKTNSPPHVQLVFCVLALSAILRESHYDRKHSIYETAIKSKPLFALC